MVGEADEAAPALVGVELDDEDLRRRQMLDQLNQLIKKEPAEVAQLLRRWMRPSRRPALGSVRRPDGRLRPLDAPVLRPESSNPMSIRPGQKLPESVAELDGVARSGPAAPARPDAAGSILDFPRGGRGGHERAGDWASLSPATWATRHRLGVLRPGHLAGLGARGRAGLREAMLVKNSLDGGEADRVIAQIQTQVQQTPFSFLQKAETDNLLTFIQDEHPQTIALIVSHLPHHKASEVLGGLPEQKQIEVVGASRTWSRRTPRSSARWNRGSSRGSATMLMHSSEKVGGVNTVAEILNLCDRSTEKSIMEGVEATTRTWSRRSGG